MRKVITYIAFDGVDFPTEEACREYESCRKLTAPAWTKEMERINTSEGITSLEFDEVFYILLRDENDVKIFNNYVLGNLGYCLTAMQQPGLYGWDYECQEFIPIEKLMDDLEDQLSSLRRQYSILQDIMDLAEGER